MALKPKALGRGLGNLIPVNESKTPIDSSSEGALREIKLVKFAQIQDNLENFFGRIFKGTFGND